MITVAVARDLVVLALGGRRRDLLLTCAQAEKLVDGLRVAAAEAELGPPSLFRGEQWALQVVSFDGFVAVRFSEITDKVPMPPKTARRLADEVEAKITEAEYKMRITWKRPVRKHK